MNIAIQKIVHLQFFKIFGIYKSGEFMTFLHTSIMKNKVAYSNIIIMCGKVTASFYQPIKN